jgi:hypothetical protein
MKCLPLLSVFLAVVPCSAQEPCAPAQLSDAADRVRRIQEGLKQLKVEEMYTDVPAEVRDLITQLKDALSCTADAALAGAGPSVDPVELQQTLAHVLSANPPQPPPDTVVRNDDHRFDEWRGSYGHNLRVQVTGPATVSRLIEVEFSINIECGEDHMLLFYAPVNGAWRRQMRWQAPPLKKTSAAFGDFFFATILPAPAGGTSGTRVVVAHGNPWCTSRFSGFDIDVLSPGADPNSPKVFWHTHRGYSRFNFTPTIRSSEDTFELLLNAPTGDPMGFERRVIYRYQIDEHLGVLRIQPIASNARGFVEEWLDAPWSEAQGFLAQGAAPALQQVHHLFEPPVRDDAEFVSYSYGPVRACDAPKTFQVQMDPTLERLSPQYASHQLPPRYFHVRETGNGYLMVSAPTEPDSTCTGPNLMPADNN